MCLRKHSSASDDEYRSESGSNESKDWFEKAALEVDRRPRKLTPEEKKSEEEKMDECIRMLKEVLERMDKRLGKWSEEAQRSNDARVAKTSLSGPAEVKNANGKRGLEDKPE